MYLKVVKNYEHQFYQSGHKPEVDEIPKVKKICELN